MTEQYEYLEPQGVIVPDTSSTLAEVQSEWQQALGADLIVTADTPQGVMITAETLARNNVIKNNAALANQINPNIAGGVFLDAIISLTGVQRNAQTPTSVTNVTLSGVVGTVLPVGTQAQTAAGDLFQLVSQVTIPSGGTTLGNFQSIDDGQIPCGDGALNQIVTAILGWETITNNQEGSPASITTLGTTTQSDQAARAFRLNTLAFNGISLAEAITSALYATEGVRSLTFQENIAATTQTINAIVMVPHSVYACVQGGTDLAVASALLENKSSGAAWNGGTNVPVIEPASGQTYAVLFDRPTPVNVYVKVTTPNGNEDQIVQSVIDYMNGLVSIQNQNGTQQTLPGFVTGADVSPFDLASAIVAENPGIYITSVQLSIDDSTFTTDPVVIGVNQVAFTQASYVSVVVP